MSLRGKSFCVISPAGVYTFKITRDWPKAIRLTINGSCQAVWIPHSCLTIQDGHIVHADMEWILQSKEFKHKFSLIKNNVKEK